MSRRGGRERSSRPWSLGRRALRSLTLGPSPQVEREGPRRRGCLDFAGLWRRDPGRETLGDFEDSGQDGLAVLEQVPVGKPEDGAIERAQIEIAVLVVGRLARIVVDLAVA